MYGMKQLSENTDGYERSVQIRIPNFNFIVTGFPWKKVEKISWITHGKIRICHTNICISA